MGSLQTENHEIKEKLKKYEVKEFDYRSTAKKNQELNKNYDHLSRSNQKLIEELEKIKHISKKNFHKKPSNAVVIPC